mmetsp:Transcript_3284/g.9110  ORF Transcript_3284/g.9110 Transcript_3284/m.9110 type:complete len:324 (-) Transcript_3284:622-1593(-)
MENWTIERLSQIAAVGRRPGVDGVGCITNLIVYNDVNSSSNRKVFDISKLHGLVNHTLSRKCSIPMKQNGNNTANIFITISLIVLFGSGLSNHKRIDAFQVTRVSYQTHVDASTIGIRAVHTGSQMVLYVTRKSMIVVALVVFIQRVVRSREFAKDQRHRFAHDIGKNVEAASVGHAQYERSRAQFTGTINGILQTRNDRLSTVQSESLGGIEFVGHEIFERVGKAESLKNVCLLLLVVLIPVRIFHPLSDPIHLVRIPNMHVFDAQGSTVCFAQLLENLSQSYLIRSLGEFFQIPTLTSARPPFEMEFAIQVGVGKAIVLYF